LLAKAEEEALRPAKRPGGRLMTKP